MFQIDDVKSSDFGADLLLRGRSFDSELDFDIQSFGSANSQQPNINRSFTDYDFVSDLPKLQMGR